MGAHTLWLSLVLISMTVSGKLSIIIYIANIRSAKAAEGGEGTSNYIKQL